MKRNIYKYCIFLILGISILVLLNNARIENTKKNPTKMSPEEIRAIIEKYRTLDDEEFKEYLNRYSYILDQKQPQSTPHFNKSEKYIWQLWLQGRKNAPEIVKKCMKTVEYFNPDKKIIV